MFSLRNLPAQGARNSLSKRILTSTSTRPFSLLLNHTLANTTPHQTATPRTSKSSLQTQFSPLPSSSRHYSAKSSADTLIEEIQDQYAVARDEFEISTEETEKKSVYAQADREAAREELDKLKEMYEKALQGGDAEEIKSRIGNRIRELDHAVQALEESAQEQ